MKDISTPNTSTPSFNLGPFNPKIFSHELFNPIVQKFMVEKSGVERSGVEAWGLNVRGWDVLQPISSHFSCAPNISGFEDAKIMKQIHSTIDWTPFVYKKTRITPYCHDFCKIDFNCEFFMSLDGFCMLGKFSTNSKIILSHQQSLMSILRTKSKWFCKKMT